MARARNTGTNPAVPEDTRMQRERLSREQEEEQRKREGNLSMISRVQAANEDQGVYDPHTDELVEPGLSESEQEALQAEYEAELAEDDEVIRPMDSLRSTAAGQVPANTLGVGPNGVPIEGETEAVADEVVPLPDAPRVGAGQAPARTVQRLDRSQATRIVRINADIEPTIGKSQYKLRKGVRYELPLDHANHLTEKGYVATGM